VLANAAAEISALRPISAASGAVPFDAAISTFLALDLDMLFACTDAAAATGR